MQFVYPYFLFALIAIAIPIILHLFNFRKHKKIYFSNVAFLKEIQQETKAIQKLKHYLVLASRILAIAFLVLAFAQPFISNKKQNTIAEDQYTQVYVDNSFSMENVSQNGPMLEVAKNLANDIANSLKESDKIELLTNNFEAKHQRFTTPEEFKQLLQDINASPNFATISEITQRFFDVQKQNQITHSHIYYISDFQKLIFNPTQWDLDSNNYYTFIPIVPQSLQNISIDSVWCASPELQANKNIQLLAKVSNRSNQAIPNIPIQLSLNEQLKNTQTFSIDANEEKIIALDFMTSQAGWQTGMVKIDDQDITFDDKYYVSFYIPEHISILEIKGKKSTNYFEKLFQKDSYFTFQTQAENQLNYASFGNYQLIVLNALDAISSGLNLELLKYVNSGGNILIIPSENIDLNSYNQLFAALKTNYFESKDTATIKMENIRANDPFFADIFEKITDNMDVPVVKNYYILSQKSRSLSETILKLRNGRKLYSKESAGNGNVFILSVPLQEQSGNFSRHTFFVITMIKTALMSYPNLELGTVLSQNTQAKINLQSNSTAPIKLKNADLSLEVIPNTLNIQNNTILNIAQQITQAGIYSVTQNEETLAYIALNYDRKESNLAHYSSEELQAMIQQNAWKNVNIMQANLKTFAKDIQQEQRGTPLWKYCILLTLFFLLIETLLLRFLK